MIRSSALALLISALAGPAAAQSAVAVEQLTPTSNGAARAQQIAPASRNVPPAAPSDRDVTAASPARPRAEETPRPVIQLGDGVRSAEPGAQVARGAPNANALHSGTDRAQGFNTSAERVRGADRCDPRAEQSRSETCARVIETRSAEFQAPDVNPLSPEQRLMVSQRELNERSAVVNEAVRRLGNGEVDETNAGIVVASLTVQQPAEDDSEDVAQPSATDAIISAVLGGLGVTPPQP